MSLKRSMISALRAKYEDEIEMADTTINIYLSNSVVLSSAFSLNKYLGQICDQI